MDSTLIALVSMGFLGAVFAAGLAVASKKFAVDVNPQVAEVEEALPGINCGACGYGGCSSFAEAVVSGEAAPNGCPVGGSDVARELCRILGIELDGKGQRVIAQVLCKGGQEEAVEQSTYQGPRDCRIAHMIGGHKGCGYGCLGLGTCVDTCPFEAMAMSDNGLPVIYEDKCTGCGNCVRACPRDIIVLAGDEYGVHIRCRSLAKGKPTRDACSVGCIACRRCVKECPVSAITVEDNLARIDYDLCINCRKCAAVCPMNTIDIQDEKPVLKKKRSEV